jgi:hypothetical protein
MSQEKLDLFQAAAILPAELGAGAAQVVRPEPLDPDLFGALLDHRPDGPAAHALFDFALFGHCPKQPPVFHSCGGVTLYSNLGITLVCYQSVSGI